MTPITSRVLVTIAFWHASTHHNLVVLFKIRARTCSCFDLWGRSFFFNFQAFIIKLFLALFCLDTCRVYERYSKHFPRHPRIFDCSFFRLCFTPRWSLLVASCVRNMWRFVKPSSSNRAPSTPTSPFLPPGSTLNGMKSVIEEEEEEGGEEDENVKERKETDEGEVLLPDTAGGDAPISSPASFPASLDFKAAKEEEEEEEEGEKEKRSASRPYFICLLWAHVAVYVWSHSWIVQLLPIPVAIVLVKKLCECFRIGWWFFFGFRTRSLVKLCRHLYK